MTTEYKSHLSPHFTLYEFVRSGAAIERGIDNRPPAACHEALAALCDNILEPLRREFGPVVISSGYRCPLVNKLAGGARRSQHLTGEAADVVACSPQRLRQYAAFIRRNLDFDQLILEPRGAAEPRWLHVSFTTRRRNRHSVL